MYCGGEEESKTGTEVSRGGTALGEELGTEGAGAESGEGDGDPVNQLMIEGIGDRREGGSEGGVGDGTGEPTVWQ